MDQKESVVRLIKITQEWCGKGERLHLHNLVKNPRKTLSSKIQLSSKFLHNTFS